MNYKPIKNVSLRQYFAAHETSLPPDSWIQATYGNNKVNLYCLHGVEFSNALAKWRYQVADAMIEEGERC